MTMSFHSLTTARLMVGVDNKRVIAAIPVVMDISNLQKSKRKQVFCRRIPILFVLEYEISLYRVCIN